jgi:hypothetical protein
MLAVKERTNEKKRDCNMSFFTAVTGYRMADYKYTEDVRFQIITEQ